MMSEKGHKRKFAEKIPAGAEGCVIMTGNVSFLDEPLVMFIRLAEPTKLVGVTEVSIDSRFLIVALGSESYVDEFHQIGRVLVISWLIQLSRIPVTRRVRNNKF